MTSSTLLGSLSGFHDLIMKLAEDSPDEIFSEQFHPELGSLAYILGECVYRELYWLREVIQENNDLSNRVAHLFGHGELSLEQQCTQLPPKDHLLNWAAEILDHHLVLLANPGMLPNHPLLKDDVIVHYFLQEHALSYERFLSQLNLARIRHADTGFLASFRLTSCKPRLDAAEISQGVYRIGSRSEPQAYDNELPPQMVNLSSFRIAHRPVSNAEYLAFIEDGGYQNQALWTDENARKKAEEHGAPFHWRQDSNNMWYGIGLNGPMELTGEDPALGLSHHEATAFANWTAALGGETEGAVLQHEYQWEAAVRTQAIKEYGRVWEWCANAFEPYHKYRVNKLLRPATTDFNEQKRSLRGGCLHTQPTLRRPSLRNRARPHWNFIFAGTRLVFPPGTPFWEKE